MCQESMHTSRSSATVLRWRVELPQRPIEDDADLDSSQPSINVGEHLIGHEVAALASTGERERLLPAHVGVSYAAVLVWRRAKGSTSVRRL